MISIYNDLSKYLRTYELIWILFDDFNDNYNLYFGIKKNKSTKKDLLFIDNCSLLSLIVHKLCEIISKIYTPI